MNSLSNISEIFDPLFWDETLKFNWDMVPVDRSFDPIKVQQYSALLREPDRSFIQELLTKTIYVPFAKFKESVFESFDLWRQNIGNNQFYLTLPTDKIGSEHWIIALLWPELRQIKNTNLVFINDSTTLPLQINNVLIIDDALYTGINTFNKIDSLVYNLAKSLNINVREAGKYFHFHLVIPYVSTDGSKYIADECSYLNSRCTMYAVDYIPGLNELIDLRKYYPSDELLKERFKIAEGYDLDPGNLPPIYFDHKVAGPMSTFSSIYLFGVVPDDGNFGSLFKVDPSRMKVVQLQQLYETWTNRTGSY